MFTRNKIFGLFILSLQNVRVFILKLVSIISFHAIYCPVILINHRLLHLTQLRRTDDGSTSAEDNFVAALHLHKCDLL